jgi:hypothetical protein
MGNKNSVHVSQNDKNSSVKSAIDSKQIKISNSTLPSVKELNRLRDQYYEGKKTELNTFIDDLVIELIERINNTAENISLHANNGGNAFRYTFDINKKLQHGNHDSKAILNKVINKIIETGDYDGYHFEVKKLDPQNA